MEHFNEFLADRPLESEIFSDPDRVNSKKILILFAIRIIHAAIIQLLESAEIIHKLSLVAQELATDKYYVDLAFLLLLNFYVCIVVSDFRKFKLELHINTTKSNACLLNNLLQSNKWVTNKR